MEFRQLGASGLRVPALSFGTATFGGGSDFYRAWGSTDVDEARRLIDVCIEAGTSFFDTANSYSTGRAEEILGAAIAGRRERVLLSTKATFPMGPGPNELGSSRHFLMRACEDSLRRLGTDHIDVYYMHGFDATTPVDETLRALDDLVTSGKIGRDTSRTKRTTHSPRATTSGSSCRSRSIRELVQWFGVRSPAARSRARFGAGSRCPTERARVNWVSPAPVTRKSCFASSIRCTTLRRSSGKRRHKSRSTGFSNVPRYRA